MRLPLACLWIVLMSTNCGLGRFPGVGLEIVGSPGGSTATSS